MESLGISISEFTHFEGTGRHLPLDKASTSERSSGFMSDSPPLTRRVAASAIVAIIVLSAMLLLEFLVVGNFAASRFYMGISLLVGLAYFTFMSKNCIHTRKKRL